MAGPMLSSGKKSGGLRRRPPMGDINVTPFVDVMLVLLIVFMITAPLITQGVQIALPEVDTAPMTEQKEPLQVTVTPEGKVYVGEKEVEDGDLPAQLAAFHQVRPDATVMLHADGAVPYSRVMEVMGALQSAGIGDVGLITQPEKKAG